MTRIKPSILFENPKKVRANWVFKKFLSFFVGGLIATLLLTIAFSLATYLLQCSCTYNAQLTIEAVIAELSKIEAARAVVDDLSISICIWVLLEVSVNTKEPSQRKFRRVIIAIIIICMIWFIIQKILADHWGYIIADFVIISVLIIFSWLHDFLKNDNIDNYYSTTGRDDGSVSSKISKENIEI